jgi:hypothetical protein
MYFYFQEMYQLPHNNDVDRIKNTLLKDRNGDFDLVMRQTTPNAQGADVTVLSRRDEQLCLDLYQAKHLEVIPSLGSNEVRSAFSSFGVSFNQASDEKFDTLPEVGSAGYSFHGTMVFCR